MADVILHGLDNPLRWRVEEFAQALPWVTRGGVLATSDPQREFNVHAVEGFIKYLQLTAIPCNQRQDCRRMSTGLMRREALDYQSKSKSLHGYRGYHGTTGEFVLAAYMAGFIPLVNNRVHCADNRDYIAYFSKMPEVFYEMRQKDLSRWWEVTEVFGTNELPTFCLVADEALCAAEAIALAGSILGRRVYAARRVVPEHYLP